MLAKAASMYSGTENSDRHVYDTEEVDEGHGGWRSNSSLNA